MFKKFRILNATHSIEIKIPTSGESDFADCTMILPELHQSQFSNSDLETNINKFSLSFIFQIIIMCVLNLDIARYRYYRSLPL